MSATADPAAGGDVDQASARRHAANALIATSLLAIAFMAMHPTSVAAQRDGAIAALPRQLRANAIVHGAMIALMLAQLFGAWGVADALGARKTRVRLGWVALLASGAAGVAAGTISGFITPAVALQFDGATGDKIERAGELMRLCVAANHAFARVWLFAAGAAALCWSSLLVAQRGAAVAIGWFGIVLGVGCVAGVVSGHLRLHAHPVLIVVVALSIWWLAIGLLLRRGALTLPRPS